VSYEEEDTGVSYEEEDTCVSYEEEDTGVSCEEEDTWNTWHTFSQVSALLCRLQKVTLKSTFENVCLAPVSAWTRGILTWRRSFVLVII
jgi:hypothetical protein